jgi:hypothetical protein
MALRGSTQVPVGPSDCDQAENLEFLAVALQRRHMAGFVLGSQELELHLTKVSTVHCRRAAEVSFLVRTEGFETSNSKLIFSALCVSHHHHIYQRITR